MKKIFEIPELEVVRFVEADIVVCSDCHNVWGCTSYTHDSIECHGGDIGGDTNTPAYETDSPIDDSCRPYDCVIYNDYTNDPYNSHYTG